MNGKGAVATLPFGLGRDPVCAGERCNEPGVKLPAPGSRLHDQAAQALSDLFVTFFTTSLTYLGVSEILDWVETNGTVDAWILTGLEQGRPLSELASSKNLSVGKGAIKSVLVAALEQDDQAWAHSLRQVGFSSGMSMAYEGIVSQLKTTKNAPLPCLHTLLTPSGLAMLKSAPLKQAFPSCPPRNPPSPSHLFHSIRSLIASGHLKGPQWKQATTWRPLVRRAFNAYHAIVRDVAEHVVTEPAFSREYTIFLESIAQPIQLFQLVADDFENEFGPGACKGLLAVGDVGGHNMFQIMDFCAAKRPSELLARVKARVAEKQEREKTTKELLETKKRLEELSHLVADGVQGRSTPEECERVRAEMDRLERTIKKAELAAARLATPPPATPAKSKALPPANKDAPKVGSSRDLALSSSNDDPFASTAPRALAPKTATTNRKGKAKAPATISNRLATRTLPPRPVSPAAARHPSHSHSPAPPSPASRSSSPISTRSKPASALTTTTPSKLYHNHPTTGDGASDDLETCCSACAAEMLQSTMAPLIRTGGSHDATMPPPPQITEAPVFSQQHWDIMASHSRSPATAHTPATTAADVYDDESAGSCLQIEERVRVEGESAELSLPIGEADAREEDESKAAVNFLEAAGAVADIAKSKRRAVSDSTAPAAPSSTSTMTPTNGNGNAAHEQKDGEEEEVAKSVLMQPDLSTQTNDSASTAPSKKKKKKNKKKPATSSSSSAAADTVAADPVPVSTDAARIAEARKVDLATATALPAMPTTKFPPPRCCPPHWHTGVKPDYSYWPQLDKLLHETFVAGFKYELIDNLSGPLEVIRDDMARQYVLMGGNMTDESGKPKDMRPFIALAAKAGLFQAAPHAIVHNFLQRTLALSMQKVIEVLRCQVDGRHLCICTLSRRPDILVNARDRLDACEMADREIPIELPCIDQQQFMKWAHSKLRTKELGGKEWEGVSRSYRVTDYLLNFADAFDVAIDDMIEHEPYVMAADLMAALDWVGGVRTLDAALRLSPVDSASKMNPLTEPSGTRPLQSWNRLLEIGKAIVRDANKSLTFDVERVAEEEKRAGNASWAKNDYKKALVSFSTAALIKPDEATYWTNSAAARLKIATRDQFSQAVADCSIALEYEPNNAKALYRRGLALAMIGRKADAIKDLTRLVDLCPDNEPAKEMLHWASSATSSSAPEQH